MHMHECVNIRWNLYDWILYLHFICQENPLTKAEFVHRDIIRKKQQCTNTRKSIILVELLMPSWQYLILRQLNFVVLIGNSLLKWCTFVEVINT